MFDDSHVVSDVGLYSYATEVGMLELTSVLALWPFSVKEGDIEAIPRNVVNGYGFDAISSYARCGKVYYLKKRMKKISISKEIDGRFLIMLIRAFQLALCGGYDKCAVILLKVIFTPNQHGSNSDKTVSETLRDLNTDDRVLRYLASRGLHRSLSLLMLHRHAYSVLDLVRVLSEYELRLLFELSTMNGSARGGIVVLNFCRKHKITPPAIRIDSMPLRTFWELSRRTISSRRRYIRNPRVKTGHFNVYFYPPRNMPKDDFDGSPGNGLVEASMNEVKADNIISIAQAADGSECDKENISTLALTKLKRCAKEPNSRPSVVIIRARGRVATFRTSASFADTDTK